MKSITYVGLSYPIHLFSFDKGNTKDPDPEKNCFSLKNFSPAFRLPD